MDDKPTIIYGSDYIAICHNGDELLYWDRQEWIDDPEVTFSIARAVQFSLNHGALALRAMLRKAAEEAENERLRLPT